MVISEKYYITYVCICLYTNSGRLVFLRKGVIIYEKVQDSMYFAFFAFYQTFCPFFRICALFAPIAILPFLVALLIIYIARN